MKYNGRDGFWLTFTSWIFLSLMVLNCGGVLDIRPNEICYHQKVINACVDIGELKAHIWGTLMENADAIE